MSYHIELKRKRQRDEEERRRRYQSNTRISSDLMNPLNSISPIYVGNDYGSSDSCSGGYDSGSSSDSGGSFGSE